MPIVRLSELNCNQDKELPHTELRRLRRRPQRPQLLAVITDLRQGSSTKKIEDSRRIIESLGESFLQQSSVLHKIALPVNDFWQWRKKGPPPCARLKPAPLAPVSPETGLDALPIVSHRI
jgi:hypothetical protein